MTELYHFTCDHGHDGLGDKGAVQPNWHPMIGAMIAWFTDLAEPERDSIGLTSESGLLSCDRMQYRYRVIDDEAHLKLKPWLGSVEQSQTNPHWQMDLHRFSEPKHWWIATRPVLVTLDT